MTKFEFRNKPHRGGAPVGYLSELTNLERNAILFLRYWSQNSSIHQHLQNEFWSDLTKKLGLSKTSKAIDAFDDAFKLCIKYSRRPIMKHELECKCIGGDESCFANIFGFASEGKKEGATEKKMQQTLCGTNAENRDATGYEQGAHDHRYTSEF